MKKKSIFAAGMIAAMVAVGTAGFTARAVPAGVRTEKEAGDRNPADEFPLEAVKQHALAASEEMDVPNDRLYGIITYGGKDTMMVADEHKEDGHYGVEYIHTYIDTDGIDAYEPEPVDMYFACPVCGAHSAAFIVPDDVSSGRVFWCKCENPWVLGLSVAKDEIR